MEEERRVASDSEAEEVVQLEHAVEMLVEQLVLPVLSRGKELGRENALSSPEYQQTVAGQVHATVLLYNYYHRKQFPQLEFASPHQLCMSTSLTITKNNLHMYLDLAHSSVANKAIIDACDIAKALDPAKNSPDMIMWPISKVAVLLLNRTKKVCLLQRGSQTKGVWSIFEKDIETALLTAPLSTGVPVQGSSNHYVALPSGPYMLQQIAYSEVELKTGMKRINLRFIEEHRVYSSSKKGTATMSYLMDYDQTTNTKIKEMPLDVLIERMSGPIYESGPCPRTTSIVEYYDLLPYKEVLLNIHIRDCPLGTSLMKDVGLKEQEANINSKCKMKKITTNVSTPKKNKQVAQAVGHSGTNNCMTGRKKKDSNTNYKRKYEAFKTEVSTYTELGDGRRTAKHLQASDQMDENRTENNSQSRNLPQDIIPISDVDPVINNDHALKSQTEKVTEKSGVQMDEKRTQDNSESRNLTQDIIPISDVDQVINGHAMKIQKDEVTEKSAVQIDDNRTENNSESRNLLQDIILTPVDTVTNNDAFEDQKGKVTKKSGGITSNMNVQMYATLKLLRKMRDDTRREHFVLDDRSAEYEMEIQKLLGEMEMTPKVTSILKKYENSSEMMDVLKEITSGEGCQTMNIKRKKLKEAIVVRNKWQELDDLCRESNWILPRYRVLPSVTEDMYQANVHLMGPDFNLSADGDMKVTPDEARDSAASNMLSRLQQKAREGLPQDIILTPVGSVVNNDALEGQKEKVTENSDGITCNMNVQMYATLKLLRNMRDDTRREHFVVDDRSAEYEMDIQTILAACAEMEMSPKVTSIIKKYENSSEMMDVVKQIASGGCQTMKIKRKKLKEAIVLRNKWQELDDLCRESNWILPRYRVLPSVTEDMYQANVHLTGPDFNLSADGDMKVTPHEARDSAASNLLSRLQQKAREG